MAQLSGVTTPPVDKAPSPQSQVSAPAETVAALPLSPLSRLVLALNGQSNALLLAPILERYADVVGSGDGGKTIQCWDSPDDVCWQVLSRQMTDAKATGRWPVQAFVWWQGESDESHNKDVRESGTGVLEPAGYYAAELESVIARVRDYIRNPSLPVFIVEIGPLYGGRYVTDETLQVIEHDPAAYYVKTSDIPFNDDGTHMSEESYDQVARRVDTMIREVLARDASGAAR